MEHLDYSEAEYQQAEALSTTAVTLLCAHYQLHTQLTKYSVADRVNGVYYETPQFTYMRMAMALAVDQPRARRMTDDAKVLRPSVAKPH